MLTLFMIFIVRLLLLGDLFLDGRIPDPFHLFFGRRHVANEVEGSDDVRHDDDLILRPLLVTALRRRVGTNICKSYHN